MSSVWSFRIPQISLDNIMLRAILNKSWQQHPTRHQLYGHLPPITKTIQVRRTRHAGHCWRSRDELIRDVLLWITHTMAAQKQDDQLERTFSSYVRIQVVVLKTYLGRWTIGRSGKRGSGISVLPARYDDDDDIMDSLLFLVFHNHMLHPALLPNYLVSDVLTQRYSQNGFFHNALCHNQFLSFGLCLGRVFVR